MARLILRKCAWCNNMFGCYSPAKLDCQDCKTKNCPSTRLVSHGLCPSCQKDLSLLTG